MVTLKAEEAYLRPLRFDDAVAVLNAFRSAPDMARQGDVETFEEAQSYVDKLVKTGSRVRPWAICTSAGLVGIVAINVDTENLSGWLYYWMTATARGQGLTSRAAATLADLAFSEWGLQRLELGHRVNNPASGAVARHAGFIKEGTERGKFLIDGQRIDVDIYGRMSNEMAPPYTPLPIKQ